MNRGFAVMMIVAGAVVAWAGWSDNSVRNVFTAPFDKTVKLNKGHAGLDAVLLYSTLYLGAKVGGSVIPGAAGAAGAAAAV